MTQIMRIQDEYRKNHDLLNGYKTAEDYERDFMSIMNTNRAEGRAEGKAEGRAEGREEGRAEGREEGKAEGREEGRAETTFAFVSAMLKKDMKLSDIMELSGLTEEKIKEIKSKI